MTSGDKFVSTLQEWIDLYMGRSMRRFLRYAREVGLSMSMIGALFHLHHQGSSGVTDLGDQLGVTSAGASQMLERLVQQGLISRAEDPHDRRVKQILLTEEGCQVLQDGIRARQDWMLELAEMLSPDEQKQIAKALKIMIKKIHQMG
jgi:DNA-binding MarR family transcriptional regulator